MQLRRPSQNPGNAPHSRDSAAFRPKPSWLREWIADKGRWVELTCGHKADLNERGQLYLEGEKKGDLLVICEQCWQIPAVKRHLTYAEYRGIPTAITPAEPLF